MLWSVAFVEVRGSMNGVLSTTDHDDDVTSAKGAGYPANAWPRSSERDSPAAGVGVGRRTGASAHLSRFAGPAAAMPRCCTGLRYEVEYPRRYLVQCGLPSHCGSRDCKLRGCPSPQSRTVFSYRMVPVIRPSWVMRDRRGDLLEPSPKEATVFGICLGHQLLGLALGATTFKLKFGHRGANQPVLHTVTGRVEITTSRTTASQCKLDTLPSDLEPTHINLNDRTLEGLRLAQAARRCSACNITPKHRPGPHDSVYLFDEFRKMLGD